MGRFIKISDSIVEKFSLGVSMIFLVIMCIINYEVIARYVFNSPTIWGWVINEQLFLITTLVGGVYAATTGGHIRIEIFYETFPKSGKLITKIFALILFVLFMAALIWKSGQMALEAISIRERAMGLFHLPIYPFKTLIPIIGVIFLIQGAKWIIQEDVGRDSK